MLALQGEVAKSVAREIDITLTPHEQTRFARVRPVNPEAHQLSLLGSFHANKGTEEGLKRAIEYFDRLLPKFPAMRRRMPAWPRRTRMSSWYVHPREAMPKAKAAAETALRLDESLAGAHAALGFVHLVYDWDAAGRRARTATRHPANPSYAASRLLRGLFDHPERHDEGVEEIRRAANLDPLSVRTHTFGVFLLTVARRYDDAIALAKKGLELDPNST